VFLSNLVPNVGTLDPVFTPSTLTYRIDVPAGTSSLTLTPTIPAGTVTIDGVATPSGTAREIQLTVGENLVPVVVSSGGVTLTYDITIDAPLAIVYIPPPTAAPVPVTAPRPTDPTNTVPLVPVTEPSGSLPVVQPGGSQVTENGQPVEVQFERVGSNTWQLTGSGYELQIEVPRPAGDSASSGAITLQRSGLVDVNGEGFIPGTLVDVWIFSTPTFLGTVKVGPDGAFEGSLPVPLALKDGRHTLQVNGTAKAGQVITMNLGVQVTSPASWLPVTGNDSWPLSVVALWVTVAGLIVIGSRRTLRR
jgi:hypothetical protein